MANPTQVSKEGIFLLQALTAHNSCSLHSIYLPCICSTSLPSSTVASIVFYSIYAQYWRGGGIHGSGVTSHTLGTQRPQPHFFMIARHFFPTTAPAGQTQCLLPCRIRAPWSSPTTTDRVTMQFTQQVNSKLGAPQAEGESLRKGRVPV